MAQRRFGPTRGAGVVVIEKEGEKTIEPGALGMAAYAGILERGPVGELIQALNKIQFGKKCGGLTPDSLLPDACHHYYDLAAGAGGLFLIRVTDGNELAAEAMLYARKASKLTPMGKLEAHNGGRWGGKEKHFTDDMSAIGDLTNVTLDTGSSAFTTDEWKGGWVVLEDVPNKRYPIIGNTNTGIVTVAADQTMLDDYNALSGSSLRYYLYLENEGKEITYIIGDGEENPTTEFSLEVFIDGVQMKKWANLSTDPTSSRYWVDLINEDGSNFWIKATDYWTGAHTADVRPASHYGLIDTVTETVMHAIINDFTINSPGGGDPTFLLGATTDEMIAQKITITMTGPTAGDAVSDKLGALGSVTLGTPFVPNNKWAPGFTVTAGVSPLVATDTLVINYFPFRPDQLIGGSLYPDKVNAPRVKFRIVDNDHDSITVADGSDLTDEGAPNDEFMVVAGLPMTGGRDGVADLVDADYNQQAYDPTLSPFNQLFGKNVGVVKMASPGVTSTAVQKGGRAYAEGRNYQWRYEVPSTVLTEEGVDAHVNDTLGRSDFAVVAFPSWGSIADPEATEPGKLKVVPTVGMIHGREAQIAVAWNGYHKAEAGLEATLPALLKIPTGETVLNEEYLNPLGIQVIKKMRGNFVIWGDRTLALDPTWKWKHQREMMSYYENVLRENFDWIVFAINDPDTEKLARSALRSFFEPEFTKRALRGKDFDDACKIKIDAENNTDATRAAGDMYADILLRLADTVERFILRIGKQGIFDAAA